MLRKITRIFFKTLGIFILFLFLLGMGLYFGFQTYSFQTWLGKKASGYLSSQLNSTVHVEAVNLEFFSKGNLKGVTILDKRRDTILQGDILINIRNFSYEKQRLELQKITLKNVTSKLIKYTSDSVFNYQFLVDYFDSGKKDTAKKQGWDVKFGDVVLDNVNFVYRKEKFVEPVTQNINFDDIWLTHTYGQISGFKLDGDTIRATIKNLTTKEQSGFVLSGLSTRAAISEKRLVCRDIRLNTPKSNIKGEIDFSYTGWDDYSDFINKVKMDARLEDSTYVHFDDIAAFASELNGLSKTVFVSGSVKGYVNDLTLKQFKLKYGDHTRFNGDLTLSGLPDISTAYLHFDAREISTSYSDLSAVPAFPFSNGKNLDLPIELKRIGTVSYRGKFDGFVTDFTTYGNFTTGLGKVSTQLSIKLGDKAEEMAYSGKLQTKDFDLGTLIGQRDLNTLTLNAEIKGKGTTIKTLNASFEGLIYTIRYNGYTYKDIKLDGKINNKLFEGLLVCKDPNADFDFNGTIDFKNKVPEMNFISTINNLKLSELKLLSNKDSGNVSSQIFININGVNLDNLSGQINFDNTIFKTKTKTFNLSSFNIEMDQAGSNKKIKLTSAYLNAGISGVYQLSNLSPAFGAFLYNYYPTFFKKPASTKKYTDSLVFKMRVKKFNAINQLFLPDVMLSPETVVEGNFDAEHNQLNMQARSSRINYRSFSINDFGMILNENNNTVLAEVTGKSLNISDSTFLENLKLGVTSVDKDSKYSIHWDNLKSPANKGEVEGQILFSNSALTLVYDKLTTTVRDSTWKLMSPNSLTLYKDGSVNVNALDVANNDQHIKITGTLSEQKNDSLIITTKNVVLEQFNSVLKLVKLKLNGVMDGNITLSNANRNFVFRGDLNLSSLKINDNPVGALIVETRYNAGEKNISLNGFTSLGLQDEFGNQVKNISFGGNYYLDRKEESLDINFSAKPANLKLLNPFLEGILTIKNAFVNGEGKIHGTPDNIKIDGKFKLFNSEIKVDYTNVTYNITGEIEVFPDQIRFSDLLMREKNSRTAPQGTVNGNIFHSNFSKMQLDYDITYRNMLVLNTTERENKTFYGKVYGSGNIGIYGFTNNLFMKIIDTTTKNSKFYLPLDGPAEIGENDFIHFVKRDTSKVIKKTDATGFNLEMTISATPEAQVQIILDKKTGDVLNVQGQGDLNMKVNTLGKFEMVGDYIITNGDYLFTLENVINKKFEIEAGSSISWSGNPMNAEINVITSYKQRASIAPLLNDNTDTYKGRFPIDCKLIITGKLFSPEVNFDIEFPNIDANTRARIDNVLSDELELNRQVFSFLLFRSFVTPQIYSSAGGVTAGNAAASTGSELLSNRVSEFLNTYFGNLTGINDLQLGLNYRPGNQNNTEAVDLALSKQFLNNKISVDGNFGVNNNQTRRSSSVIGDVNIDYKLSADGKFKLRGFNRSNDNTQLVLTGAQYTQGFGVFYREEFETFDELFKRYLKNMKKKSPEKKASTTKPD